MSDNIIIMPFIQQQEYQTTSEPAVYPSSGSLAIFMPKAYR